MSREFKFYKDASHGWLAVKAKLLDELGIASLVSNCSYYKGSTVYLEEDSDMHMFQDAYVSLYGSIQFKEIDHGMRSWVRNLNHYGAPVAAAEVLPVTDEALMETVDGIGNAPKSDF